MAEVIIFASLVILIYMTIWWLYSQIIGRSDIADVAWGLGFITLAISLAIRADVLSTQQIVAVAMVTIWGLRLAVHIGLRRRGKPEDGRYVTMKQSWRFKNLQNLTNVFLSQGFFMLLVSAPIILLFFGAGHGLAWYNYLGIVVWAVGIGFEAIGDWQLSQFLAQPKNKGKVMRYGLWRYTRHPNYFGEISSWWGFYIFALFTPYWYVGLIGPLAITFLIIGLSGIPMLERRYNDNPEYQKYKRSTSAFFPAGPKL
jgi:steroid 5-alpha reductase family enzyme